MIPPGWQHHLLKILNTEGTCGRKSTDSATMKIERRAYKQKNKAQADSNACGLIPWVLLTGNALSWREVSITAVTLSNGLSISLVDRFFCKSNMIIK